MGVKISYKDGANHVDIDNKIQYLVVSRNLNKLGRVIPNFVAPVTVSDNWGGYSNKVQVTRYNSFYVQFAAKEDQENELSVLATCDTITIEDIDNNTIYTADTQTGESFVISELEKVGTTTNQIVTIFFRTGKTVIDKITPRANIVTFAGGSTYYSKFPKLTYTAENTNIEIPWSDGTVKVLSQVTNIGYNIVFYFTDAELSTFYEDYGQNDFTIDGVPVIKKLPAQPTPIAENLTKVIVQVITEVSKNLDLSVTKSSETNVINIDALNNFYTDYPVDAGYQATEQSKPPSEDGFRLLTHAITRQVSIVKFWMTNAELAVFKPLFETSQAIKLNTIDLLENRPLQVTPLDYDINEVIAECLITATTSYPQQP